MVRTIASPLHKRPCQYEKEPLFKSSQEQIHTFRLLYVNFVIFLLISPTFRNPSRSSEITQRMTEIIRQYFQEKMVVKVKFKF